MTETAKSENYTNKFLQKDTNPTTMEVVTQTNAVKSPTDSPATTKLVYTVEEIARRLAISLRSAYNLCNSTTECRVLRVGGSIRVPDVYKRQSTHRPPLRGPRLLWDEPKIFFLERRYFCLLYTSICRDWRARTPKPIGRACP